MAQNKNPYLSVVIPMYNEMKNLQIGVLDDVYKYLVKQKYSWEVLIVDDKSTDKSLNFAKKFAASKKNIRVLGEPHRGKGGTVIAGILAARGEIVLFTDMDQATPINQLEKILPKFKDGFDGVIGSRAGREGAPLVRKVMAYGFMTLRAVILRLPYHDTQCGFKAFRRESANKIFGKMKVFEDKKVAGAAVTAGFDLEMLYIARKCGVNIAEVPVEWHHKGTERVSAIRDSWQGFTDLVKVRINAIEGKYRVN